ICLSLFLDLSNNISFQNCHELKKKIKL
ncbi:hypothetical protein, partial [Plasmodium yoelii yoelii]